MGRSPRGNRNPATKTAALCQSRSLEPKSAVYVRADRPDEVAPHVLLLRHKPPGLLHTLEKISAGAAVGSCPARRIVRTDVPALWVVGEEASIRHAGAGLPAAHRFPRRLVVKALVALVCADNSLVHPHSIGDGTADL